MISALIAAAGAVTANLRVLSFAFKADRQRRLINPSDSLLPRVSVIVPARNEEQNLPPLLSSLTASSYKNLEIIVIDDQSTDRTFAVATGYGDLVRVIKGQQRPDGWGGKQWACQQGADAATGDLLLFTDADTVHATDGISSAVAFMQASNADMISAPPAHAGRATWERLTGFFQIMLMFAANAFGKQVPGRAYCIGQYIMIRKQTYIRLGGHGIVRSAIVEDVPMANAALKAGLIYEVYLARPLYEVRMYETLAEFIKGWRRNFRAGLRDSSLLASIEVTVIIGALILGGTMTPGIVETTAFIVAVTALYRLVRRFCDYGPLSLIGIPFSIGLFCWITALAVYDSLLKRDVLWKGRTIKC